MDSKEIGKIIKKYREEKGISQECLSGFADVDRSHLSKIELGLRSPTINALYKIAGALEVKASDILREAEQDEDGTSDK